MNYYHARTFKNILKRVINFYAPLKQKYLRENNQLFMNKEHSKALVHRSRLPDQFFRDGTAENKRNYSKQRNLRVSLLRKSISQCRGNIVEKKVIHNKSFWKMMIPTDITPVLIKEKRTRRKTIDR